MKLYSLTNCNLHCTFAAKLPASLWTFFLWSAGIHRHSLLLSLSHSTTHKGAALLLQQRMWMNLLQTNQCSAVFSCHCLVSAQLTWNLNRCTRYYPQWKKGGEESQSSWGGTCIGKSFCFDLFFLSPSLSLHQDGIISVKDVDLVMSEGLGMRYAFIGPMETIHLNAPEGNVFLFGHVLLA